MFCHFGEKSQCQDDMKLIESFDESKVNTHINFKRLDIINNALQKTTNEVSPLVKSGITTLTYCVHIGSIFVEYFINKTKKITRDNIDYIDILIKLCLCYFARWKNKAVEISKTCKWEKKWSNTFMSNITYTNLRHEIAGF